MERIFANIRDGKPSVGILVKGGPETVDYIAQAGFDFIIPDMMFSCLDWGGMHHLIRAAHANHIDCFPRIQANPWSSDRPDRRLAVDAARTLFLGADGVCMSVSSSEEVKEIVTVTGSWHRGVAISSGKQVKEHEERAQKQTLVFPLIESQSAIEDVDRIIDVEGLTGIFIAWTDFTKALGFDFEYEHPEVLKVVNHIIERSRKRGLVVMANTGYAYKDIEANAQRITRMSAMGVQIIMMQTVDFVVHCSLKNVRERYQELGAKVRPMES